MHRAKSKIEIGSKIRVCRQVHSFGVVLIAIMAVATLNGSCIRDTKTTLCEATGLRCRPGQICASGQGVCIDIGGCGDGVTDEDEVCDDGNIINGDGCSADCSSNEVCGNGIIEVSEGETCDDGNSMGGDGCSRDCHAEVCGNQVIDREAGEVCDDGNSESLDGCREDCRSIEVCGNGVIDSHLGEQCEFMERPFPNPPPDTVVCDRDCTLPECGDGHLNPAVEVCDRGPPQIGCPGKTCNSTCSACI